MLYNNMKKVILYLLFFVIICINILLLIKVIYLSGIKDTNAVVVEKYSKLDAKYNLLLGNIALQLNSEDYHVNDILLEDENQNKFRLSSIIDNEPHIILRFTEKHCSSCVDYSLKELMNYAECSDNLDNIVILASYDNVRKLKAFIKSQDLTIPIFNTGHEMLDIPIERIGMPYLFVLDNLYRTKYVFIPAKEIYGYTRNYLNIITKRLEKH